MYHFAELDLGGGRVALGPMPRFARDLDAIAGWRAGLVLSLVTEVESGGFAFESGFAARGIDWRHWPIPDFGTPTPQAGWPALSAELHDRFATGGRVFVHCMGGCGRSGMVVLRLMIESGQSPAAALGRLRGVRPCAVETDDQLVWAKGAQAR